MRTPFPALVVLAAGRSSRMGSAKAWLEVEPGLPLVAWQMRQFRASGGREIVVALGSPPDAAQRAALGDALVVVNERPESGPFSSLQLGLRAAAGGAAFVLPIDVPVVEPNLFVALADALQPGLAAVVPRHGGRGGHPVLLAASFVAELLALAVESPAARLDHALRSLPPAALASLAVSSPSILVNLNDPEAWDAFMNSRDGSAASVL